MQSKTFELACSKGVLSEFSIGMMLILLTQHGCSPVLQRTEAKKITKSLVTYRRQENNQNG